MPPDVVTLAEQFHADLLRQDAQALGRIVDAYGGIVRRLQGEIDALAFEIAEMDEPTRGKIERLARYRRLIREAAGELERYQTWLETEIGTLGRGMVTRGITDSRELIAAAYGDARIAGLLRDLPPETVERLLGFLDPAGPLYERLGLLGPETVDRLAQYILESVAMGKNPRTWAKEITKVFGMGLNDSLRMARTVQLWSYREATRANYIANNDVVKKWVWFARLDGLTCMSCVAMHGTVHELSEPLNDHHNGRCAAIPVTITNANPVRQSGEEWFAQQSEAFQRASLGKGRYEAWKEGKFTFDRLSGAHTDGVYGEMRVERTLKELLGS